MRVSKESFVAGSIVPLQNGYLSLRDRPDRIVGSLTYWIVDERQGTNISTNEKGCRI